ncbi:polyphosphate kinase [Marinomonas hwangdonensis]|uniref:Polyphosphate kinase n=1 Tax=Marinomonas hwangdonensis TaxID=1053647 RepID=A0A3M8Q5Z7_9GAMM|nr:PPK2 family polyphosphate kinase [Marinomonas hwangdonensis]RNF51493.1 polyphosphate kinase [Marinomonas hwangdonensis]
MFLPSPIILSSHVMSLKHCDVDNKQYSIDDKKTYRKILKKRQKEMQRVQQAYYHQGKRAIIIFQGWDASGKGGAIRRLTEYLDPRGYRVHPIAAPSAEEQGKHYLYRFQTKLPKVGTLAIFDRSWYERVLTERVEGFASDMEWQRAYQEINEYERMLTDDGVKIIKIFTHISKDEQLERFEERLRNPLKQWKLTEEDIRNREKWDEHENAINDMLELTSTEQSPWHVIPANHKWYTRIAVLETVVNALSEGMDLTPPPIDEALVRSAEHTLGITLP